MQTFLYIVQAIKYIIGVVLLERAQLYILRYTGTILYLYLIVFKWMFFYFYFILIILCSLRARKGIMLLHVFTTRNWCHVLRVSFDDWLIAWSKNNLWGNRTDCIGPIFRLLPLLSLMFFFYVSGYILLQIEI